MKNLEIWIYVNIFQQKSSRFGMFVSKFYVKIRLTTVTGPSTRTDLILGAAEPESVGRELSPGHAS